MTYRTGRRSRLGDLIVMHGPYVSGALVPNPVMRFIESDELNALRDELAELRDIDTGCECLHAPVDGCTRVGMHNCAGTWSDHGHPGGRPGPPSMGADQSQQADPNCVYPDGVCGCGEPEGHGDAAPSDGDAPSRPLSAPVSDLQPPLVAQSGVTDPNALETAYPEPAWHQGCTGCWHTIWHRAEI